MYIMPIMVQYMLLCHHKICDHVSSIQKYIHLVDALKFWGHRWDLQVLVTVTKQTNLATLQWKWKNSKSIKLDLETKDNGT